MNLGHLSQYRKLAVFLYKYGTSDLVKHSGLSDALGELSVDEVQDSHDIDPQQMVKDIKDMGPAFIKMGQLLSTRPDLLPPAFIDALSHLQDEIEPFPIEQVEEIVQSELGTRISKAFKTFDREPLASASLGQVHLAELRDGQKVVVKVQRPGIREKIIEEMEVLETTASFLENNTDFGRRFECTRLVQQFRKTLFRELSYLREAENMKRLHLNLKEFEHLAVPTPIDDYTTDKVLTMQYLKGRKITKVSPLTRIELNGHVLADELFKAYLKQIVVDGFMHADPHPGNIHLLDDHRIALLDMGMVAYISDEYQKKYLQLLLALSQGQTDKLAHLLMDMSKRQEEADEDTFKAEISDLVQENRSTTMENLQTGKVIFALIRAAGENGFLLPAELSLVAKALLNLDQVGRILAPDFSPNVAIKQHAMDLMQKHMLSDLAPQNLFSTLLESKKLAETMPERINKILENASENKIRMKIDAFDEHNMMVGLQKIANRITMGLILAALVVGCALMMRIPTSFTIWGYPGLAMIFFLLAAIGAIVLLVKIIAKDE